MPVSRKLKKYIYMEKTRLLCASMRCEVFSSCESSLKSIWSWVEGYLFIFREFRSKTLTVYPMSELVQMYNSVMWGRVTCVCDT